MSDEISVELFGGRVKALKIRVPCVAKTHVGHGDHITLTRDEAFDLLEKLRMACSAWLSSELPGTGEP